MKTVIIAESLINDFASPLPEFEKVVVNVGPRVIRRTMGAGEAYGQGPLPAFLRAAVRARVGGGDVHLVLVRDLHDDTDEQKPELSRFGDHAMRGSEGAAFVPWAADLEAHAHVIDTPTLALPTVRLHEVLTAVLGKNVPALTAADRDGVRFVLCGFHTDTRVTSTAFRLRNELGFRHVLVCPHLVGSNDERAHELALQVGMPNALVTVVPSLRELANDLGLDLKTPEGCDRCRIEPPEVASGLRAEQRAALEVLFMFDTSVRLKPLGGGFSGSLLFLATPSRDGQQQAPLVVKVDKPDAIRREVRGHHRVSGLLGTHVPAMHAPITEKTTSGVKMTLAAMEGRPRTLQDLYSNACDESGWNRFTTAFEKALGLLSNDLYRNTRRRAKLSPYHANALTGPQHERWLRKNLANILPGADLEAETLPVTDTIDISNPVKNTLTLLDHLDLLDVDVSLCHGDLNFANLLTDDTGAVWIIDWPWCDDHPIETDFAKMENDLTFVVSQAFTEGDLPNLLAFQRFLADTPVPPITPPLDFIERHAELRKLYHAVRLLREHYHALKTDAHHELHAIARLRFALHTLSFNKSRNEGDCEPPQLKHALITVSVLTDLLRNSPLHQRGARERPEGYPQRCAVPLDREPWDVPLDGYEPPDASWSHPADEGDDDDVTRVRNLRDRAGLLGALRFDERGRPLNPLGRTGLGGRGFFYRWGPNLAVDAVVTRVNPSRHTLEFALVKRGDTGQWGLPGTFVREGERPQDAVTRVTREKLGLAIDPARAEQIDHGPVWDYRNTDNAWVETIVFAQHLDEGARLAPSSANVRDAAWIEVDEHLAPHLFASHARIIGDSIGRFLARNPPGTRVKREPLEALVGRL